MRTRRSPSRIDVQTDGVISQDQLAPLGGVKPGENLLALRSRARETRLELVPLIQSGSLERVLPATLRIRVTEREPVARSTCPRPATGGRIEVDRLSAGRGRLCHAAAGPAPASDAVGRPGGRSVAGDFNGINFSDLQPGRRIGFPPVQAALQLIVAFEKSPMAGLVDLKRVDVSAARKCWSSRRTGKRSDLWSGRFRPTTAALAARFMRNVRRLNKAIATLDLAVTNNIPLRLLGSQRASARCSKNRQTPTHQEKKCLIPPPSSSDWKSARPRCAPWSAN